MPSPSRAKRAPATRSCAGGARRTPGFARNRRQECGHCFRRLRSRQGDRGHAALGLRQLRPGLSRHRARLCRAADFRRLCRRLKAGAERLKPGRPEDSATTLGPLVSQEHRAKVLVLFQAGGGGRRDVGHRRRRSQYAGRPCQWRLGPADHLDRLERRRARRQRRDFRPLLPHPPLRQEEEAVTAANATPYGLAAAIWTENLSRAHRVAAKIDVGICWVNSWFLRDLRTAFGGAKQSGIGREGGVHSLEFYTELSNVCIKL